MATDGRTDDASKANRAATDRRAKRKVDDPYEGSFGRYMELKVQKLREQFQDEAMAGMHSEEERRSNSSCLFRGIRIHVNGYTKPTHQELRQLMVRHGGMFENYSRSRVTHIICSHLPDGKIKELRSEKNPPPVVCPEWITDSIAAGKLLPYGSYQLQRLLFAYPGQRMLTESIIPRTPISGCLPRVEEVGHSEQPQAVGSSWEACRSSTGDAGVTCASDSIPGSSSAIMAQMQNDPLCHSVAAACINPDEVQVKQDAAQMVDLSGLEGHLAMNSPQFQTGLQNGCLSVKRPLTSIADQDKLFIQTSVHDGPCHLTASCDSSPDGSAIRSLFQYDSTTTAVRTQPGTMAMHSSLQMSHGEKSEKVVSEIRAMPPRPQRTVEQSRNGWTGYKDGERVTVRDDTRHVERQATANMDRFLEQSVPLELLDLTARDLSIEKPAEILEERHGGALSAPFSMSGAEQPIGCASVNERGPFLEEAEQVLFDSRMASMDAGENRCATGHVDGRTIFGEGVKQSDRGAVSAGEERGSTAGNDPLIGNQEDEEKAAIGSTGRPGTGAGQMGTPLVPPQSSVHRLSGKIPDPKRGHSTQSDPNFIQNYYKV